jgi:hypothetical protein
MYIGNATCTENHIMTTYVEQYRQVKGSRSVDITYIPRTFRTRLRASSTIGVYYEDSSIPRIDQYQTCIGVDETGTSVYVPYTDLVPCAQYHTLDTMVYTLDIAAYVAAQHVVIFSKHRQEKYMTNNAIRVILIAEICDRVDLYTDGKWVKYEPIISVAADGGILIDREPFDIFLKRLVGI